MNLRSKTYLEEYDYLWGCKALKKLRLRNRMDSVALLNCALDGNWNLQELILKGNRKTKSFVWVNCLDSLTIINHISSFKDAQ